VPVWIDKRALMLLHTETLAQFGGVSGLRDESLLESAYGFGLARKHPFVDGNKRMAFLAVGVFLAINAHRLSTTPVDAIDAMLALAAGSMDEVQFGDWIKRHLVAAP